MNRTINITIVFLVIALQSVCAVGQEKRQWSFGTFNVTATCDYSTASDYTIVRKGTDVEKGTMEESFKARLRLSSSIYKNRHLNLSVGGFFNYYNTGFSPGNALVEEALLNLGSEHYLYGPSLSAFYRGKLAGRMIVGNLYLATDFSEYGFEKITGYVVASTPLKQTQNTQIGVGLIGLINTTSPFPVFPIFTIRHKFNSKVSAELMLPQFQVHYALPKYNAEASAGLSIDGERYYVRPENDMYPQICLYSRSMIRPELSFVKSFGKSLSITLKAGMNIMMSNNIYKRTGSEKLIEVSQSANCYIGTSIGYRWNK